MVTVLQIFCDLLVPGVYVIFAFTGHGCVHQNVNYFIPVNAHGSDPRQCISSVTVSNNLQQRLCRVFKFLDCCRVKRCSHCLVLSILFLCQFYVTDQIILMHVCQHIYTTALKGFPMIPIMTRSTTLLTLLRSVHGELTQIRMVMSTEYMIIFM